MQKNISESGQLLVEMILAIAGAVIVLSLGSQLIYTGLISNKAAGDKSAAVGLIDETFNAVEGATVENWNNLFNLTKPSTAYYPQKSAGKWVIATGTEAVSINNITYARSFTIQNVCRSSSTVTGISDTGGLAVTCATNGGSYDPSTQRVSVTVTASSSDPLVSTKYVTRWRNKVCAHTSWLSTSTGVVSCPSTVYTSKTNVEASSSITICSGC
ncbi:MAG: hypothetical protein WCV80_00655 [Candidatus Paceibacterota bacterium]|jgi:hypothetical protein